MRVLHIGSIVLLLAAVGTTAHAQYGLYGSPEILRVQDLQPPVQAYNYANPTPTVYQAGPMPAPPSQPMGPAPGYQPFVAPAPAAGYQPNVAAVPGNVYSGPCNQYQQAAAGCGLDAAGPCCCQWYGAVLALAMTRDKPNKLWTSYNSNDECDQILNSRDASVGWQWGGEVVIGHCFCCNQWAIEADFWGLREFDACASACVPGGHVNTTFAVSAPDGNMNVTYNGTDAKQWFFGSEEQKIWRTDEVYSLEINLVRLNLCGGGCGGCGVGCGDCGGSGGGCCRYGSACGLSFDCLAGFRFFRFREDLVYGARAWGSTGWDDQGGLCAAYFRDEIDNNLWVAQIGCDVAYQCSCRLRFFVTPKFGIFDNHITSDFSSQTGSGVLGYSTAYQEHFPIHGCCDSLAFLTQVDVGVDWLITDRLSLRAGYRVLAATGVGLADNQFPVYVTDTQAMRDIQHNGNLVLSGVFAGLTYCF